MRGARGKQRSKWSLRSYPSPVMRNQSCDPLTGRFVRGGNTGRQTEENSIDARQTERKKEEEGMTACNMPPRSLKTRSSCRGQWGSDQVGAAPLVGNSAPIIRSIFGISTSTDRPSGNETITRRMEDPRSRTTLEPVAIVADAHIASPQGVSGGDASVVQPVVTSITTVTS